MTLSPKIITQLKEKELEEVLVVLGGIVPEEDIEPLRQIGIHGVFGPGTSTEDIVNFIRENIPS